MQNEQYRAKLEKSNERSLALIKAGMDVVVAFGLLQLAPKRVTPRVTGAFGFASSLISCYQVFSGSHFKKTVNLGIKPMNEAINLSFVQLLPSHPKSKTV